MSISLRFSGSFALFFPCLYSVIFSSFSKRQIFRFYWRITVSLLRARSIFTLFKICVPQNPPPALQRRLKGTKLIIRGCSEYANRKKTQNTRYLRFGTRNRRIKLPPKPKFGNRFLALYQQIDQNLANPYLLGADVLTLCVDQQIRTRLKTHLNLRLRSCKWVWSVGSPLRAKI